MCGTGGDPKSPTYRGPFGIRTKGGVIQDWNIKDSDKESTPPVQRSAPSSSGGPTSLGIRRGSSSARKQSVSSGRSRSKSKRFSTTR
jgi:hypothetical protein